MGRDAVFKVGGKMFAVACTDAAYPNAKACSFKSVTRASPSCANETASSRRRIWRAPVGGARLVDALPDREIAARVAAGYATVRPV